VPRNTSAHALDALSTMADWSIPPIICPLARPAQDRLRGAGDHGLTCPPSARPPRTRTSRSGAIPSGTVPVGRFSRPPPGAGAIAPGCPTASSSAASRCRPRPHTAHLWPRASAGPPCRRPLAPRRGSRCSTTAPTAGAGSPLGARRERSGRVSRGSRSCRGTSRLRRRWIAVEKPGRGSIGWLAR